MTTGFDLDEIERALARSKAEPEDLEDQGFWTEARVITIFPDMLTEIRELRAENARLKEALSHAQGRFLNINIALSSGGTKREAIRIADVGEDCAKNALARAALGEPQ